MDHSVSIFLPRVMVPDYRAPVHPDDAAQVYARRQEGLTKGIPFENELRSRRRDGDYRFLWRYIPVHDGGKARSFAGR